MPRARLVLAVVAAAAVPVAPPAAARAAAPPALSAKRVEAQVVLADVQALDVRFGKVVDAWDGARVRLVASRHALAGNRRALVRATKRGRAADSRLAQRLVAIYKGEEPSLAEVIVGAATLSQLLDRLEAATAISAYDRRLADEAARARASLARARVRLRATERTRRAAVARLASSKRRIGSLLARRRRMLASVRSEVASLQRQEAAHQAALAAAARVRLARERALRAKQEAAARAKPAAPAAAPAPATTAAPTPAATTTTPAPAAVPTAPATTAPSLRTAPAALGAGHPEAASVALTYLGVRYRWGGASPATGFDCSGLVMFVYAQIGIALPHQSEAQYGYGTPVARSELQPGDLVFFDGLSHVGIYIGNGEMVHAPQTGDVVKITPLSQFPGSRYVGARRLP